MPEPPSSNAKIYARPEKKAPSPIYIALAFLVLLTVGFFTYRMYFRAASTSVPLPTGHTSRGLPDGLSRYAVTGPYDGTYRNSGALGGQRRA